ncbi:MAG: hypothetical protein JKY13_00495 [Gammaproteobacteria bacterium]|nr:hypothetical protein [Gammaproteobacteria bacterium]
MEQLCAITNDWKIIDEHCHSLPVDEVDKLCLRDSQAMRGYWQNLEETAQVLTKKCYIVRYEKRAVDSRVAYFFPEFIFWKDYNLHASDQAQSSVQLSLAG